MQAPVISESEVFKMQSFCPLFLQKQVAEACKLWVNQVAQNYLHLLTGKYFYSLEIEGENVCFFFSLFSDETCFSFEIYLMY